MNNFKKILEKELNEKVSFNVPGMPKNYFNKSKGLEKSYFELEDDEQGVSGLATLYTGVGKKGKPLQVIWCDDLYLTYERNSNEPLKKKMYTISEIEKMDFEFIEL